MTVKWQAIGSGYAAIIFEGWDRYFSRRSGGETGMATQRMATFVKVDGRWLLESLKPVVAKPMDIPMNEPTTGSLAEEKKRLAETTAELASVK